MSGQPLCDRCAEPIDDPGMDLCSHCARETAPASVFKVRFEDYSDGPTKFELMKPTPIVPGQRRRKCGKGPRHAKPKR